MTTPIGPVTADDLAAAVTGCVEALRAGVDADWSVPAGVLQWSCRDTAEHLAEDLFCYAVQLAWRRPVGGPAARHRPPRRRRAVALVELIPTEAG